YAAKPPIAIRATPAARASGEGRASGQVVTTGMGLSLARWATALRGGIQLGIVLLPPCLPPNATEPPHRAARAFRHVIIRLRGANPGGDPASGIKVTQAFYTNLDDVPDEAIRKA